MLNSTNLYTQNTWTQKANFTATFRPSPVSFSIGGKGYIGAGGGYGPGQFELDFWEYNPITDTWSQKADIGNIGRINAISFVINNKAYVGLGQNWSFLSDIWEYDPSINVWTRKNDFPGNTRIDASTFVVNNKGYVTCGFDIVHFKDLWEYNPTNDSWLQKTDFPGTPRRAALGFGIKDKGYFGAGVETNTWVSFYDFWDYNPSNDTWTQKANHPDGHVWGSSFVVGYKGYSGISFGSKLYEYDPFLDSWTRKADLTNLYRAYGIGFNIGNKGYMGLGSDNSSTQYNDFWEYTPGTTPSIETYEPISTYDTVAILKGQIIFDGNYSVSKRGFVWSTSPNPTLNNYVGGGYSISSNNTIFIDTIKQFKENTKYYYRAYATNSQGTSYGNEQTLFTKFSIAIDGNQDGIADSLQNYVKTIKIINTDKYITIEDLNKFPLYAVTITQSEDKDYIYPYRMLSFKVNTSNTTVRIYYHGLTSLDKYLYRKLNSVGKYYSFSETKFDETIILGQKTYFVDLTLTDGGAGDYDGVANGVIHDPGGIAIPVSAINIPTLSEWARVTIICLLLLFGIKIIRK